MTCLLLQSSGLWEAWPLWPVLFLGGFLGMSLDFLKWKRESNISKGR